MAAVEARIVVSDSTAEEKITKEGANWVFGCDNDPYPLVEGLARTSGTVYCKILGKRSFLINGICIKSSCSNHSSNSSI